MNEVTKIWKQFTTGLQYLKSVGLIDEWKQCEKFYEGDQWPQATEKTRNLPRPVVNVCSMIADNKKAGILSGNVKILFKPAEMFGDKLELAEQGADIFSKFAENVKGNLKQEELDERLIEDSTQIGTSFIHYFWDKTISGGLETPYVGGLNGEIIHPRNVILSNPLEKDIQNQQWIIIASCESLTQVREYAKKRQISNIDEIVADNELDESKDITLKTCTVLTKYSRVNGKVVWEKATKNVLLQGATLWEPNKEKVKFDSEDKDDLNLPEEGILKETNYSYKKQLYPIVMHIHKKRKDNCYGIGEVIQAIPNNKAINFNLGMMLLSVQETAWPKIIQKAGALASQQITNAPGEIITDTSGGFGTWGVKYLENPGFNAQALTLTNSILDLTRTFTGSTEVVTGEVLGANMAASAIIALQNQAKKPIEIHQKKFYRTYKNIGKIYEQFFKYFYNDGRLFSYEENNETLVVPMNGQNYVDIDFNLSVEVGAGGIWSESLSIGLLDSLKASGDITSDEYIELYPETIMTFKTKLKRMREQRQQELDKLQEQQIAEQVVQDQMLNEIPQEIQTY